MSKERKWSKTRDDTFSRDRKSKQKLIFNFRLKVKLRLKNVLRSKNTGHKKAWAISCPIWAVHGSL